MPSRCRSSLRLLALATALNSVVAFAQEAAPAAVAAAESPAASPNPMASPNAAVAVMDCVEVNLFEVSQEKVEGQTDRAAAIPPRNLEIIRDDVVKHLPQKVRGVTAVASGLASCPNALSTAVLSGEILDFRKGNMALRYFVGFGAGSQKVRVRLTLKRKADEVQLAQSEVADTKWAGAFGGTNTKGLDDFAEKAAEAAARGLK